MSNDGILMRIADALERVIPKQRGVPEVNNTPPCPPCKEPKKDDNIGEIHINVTINKEEILRALEEIRKTTEEVAMAVKKLAPLKSATDYIVVTHGDGSSTTITYADAPTSPTMDTGG